MRSLTWVGVSGSNKGWRNTHRIASVSPISCPAPEADASFCFNSLILLAISGSIVSPDSRASRSTIGPQCEIWSLISVSCRSSSLSFSLADSYIFVAVSSGIMDLYKNVLIMSIVISHIFTIFALDFQLLNYQITHLPNLAEPTHLPNLADSLLPAPEPEGRNSLARVRKPRVDGRKPMSPVGAALFKLRNRPLESVLCNPARYSLEPELWLKLISSPIATP